jgi:hypothetical protein
MIDGEMRSLRVLANRVLWRWGCVMSCRDTAVHRMPVTECCEPLEPIPTVLGRLLLEPRLSQPHLARRSVAGALHQAAELLPEDVQLLVVEGYRSPALQKHLWALPVSDL